MVDSLGETYGVIELRRVMNETDVRYRCEFRRDVIGWGTTLRGSCEQIHQAFLRSHGPAAGIKPENLYPDLKGSTRRQEH